MHSEHDESVDLIPANQNQTPIRVLIGEGTNWDVYHAHSRMELEAFIQTAKATGSAYEYYDPNTGEKGHN